MHELSLVTAILRIVEEQAVAEHFRRVIRVNLGVGELSNVEVQALAFCFEIARRGSLAHDAALSIQTIPGEARCERCNKNVHIELRTDPCPYCGGWRLLVTGGDQITVKELEVE